jgi:hypothetical protein
VPGCIKTTEDNMMELDEMKGVQGKFKQGLEKLELVNSCLAKLKEQTGLEVVVDSVDKQEGVLTFWFAGTRYYVKIRLTDRGIDNVGTEYNVAIGWLDWGRCSAAGDRASPEQSNYYDERGILCQLEKEEFYCNFENCDEEKLRRGMLYKLQRLVGRTIAVNNAIAP